jgi:hypothetical protein
MDGPNKQSIGLTYQVTVGPLGLIQREFLQRRCRRNARKERQDHICGLRTLNPLPRVCRRMHGISPDGRFAREKGALRENGQRLVSDGAALGKETVTKYLLTKQYAHLVI